jgi:hypothetical protein
MHLSCDHKSKSFFSMFQYRIFLLNITQAEMFREMRKTKTWKLFKGEILWYYLTKYIFSNIYGLSNYFISLVCLFDFRGKLDGSILESQAEKRLKFTAIFYNLFWEATPHHPLLIWGDHYLYNYYYNEQQEKVALQDRTHRRDSLWQVEVADLPQRHLPTHLYDRPGCLWTHGVPVQPYDFKKYWRNIWEGLFVTWLLWWKNSD